MEREEGRERKREKEERIYEEISLIKWFSWLSFYSENSIPLSLVEIYLCLYNNYTNGLWQTDLVVPRVHITAVSWNLTSTSVYFTYCGMRMNILLRVTVI